MKTFAPPASLGDRVVSIDVVDSDGGEAMGLPSAGAVLGFQFHGRVRSGERFLSPAGVTGIQSAARTYAYDGETASLLVRFTPQGASCLGVHMREEEQELEPTIRTTLSEEELIGFGRRAVERTAPADQRRMLAWMLPAMTSRDAEAFLTRLPGDLADELRPLAGV